MNSSYPIKIQFDWFCCWFLKQLNVISMCWHWHKKLRRWLKMRRFFWRIRIKINNPGSLGSLVIEKTDDSLPRMNPLVSDAPYPNKNIYILIRNSPKEFTLKKHITNSCDNLLAFRFKKSRFKIKTFFAIWNSFRERFKAINIMWISSTKWQFILGK